MLNEVSVTRHMPFKGSFLVLISLCVSLLVCVWCLKSFYLLSIRTIGVNFEY